MKYNVITIMWNGCRVVFTNVEMAIVYENEVALLKVHAEVNPDNIFMIIDNGIHFKMNDHDRYCMEFLPTQLVEAA